MNDQGGAVPLTEERVREIAREETAEQVRAAAEDFVAAVRADLASHIAAGLADPDVKNKSLLGWLLARRRWRHGDGG